MAKKWCVWNDETQEVFLRHHRDIGFTYQYARSLAVEATKQYGGKYVPKMEPIEN